VDEQKVNGIYGAARTLGWYSWKRSSTCSSFADLSHTSVDFIFEKAKNWKWNGEKVGGILFYMACCGNWVLKPFGGHI
jgi:hypothetical protein